MSFHLQKNQKLFSANETHTTTTKQADKDDIVPVADINFCGGSRSKKRIHHRNNNCRKK